MEGGRPARSLRRLRPELARPHDRLGLLDPPVPDARASAPLSWGEVPTVEPEEFTLRTMSARVQKVGDLTAGMWRRKVSLASRFEQLGLEAPEP